MSEPDWVAAGERLLQTVIERANYRALPSPALQLMAAKHLIGLEL